MTVQTDTAELDSGLDMEDPFAGIDLVKRLEEEPPPKDEGDSVETPQNEAEPKPDAPAPEDDDQAEEPKAEEEDADDDGDLVAPDPEGTDAEEEDKPAVASKPIEVKFLHETIEFDPYADEDRTRTLIQRGLNDERMGGSTEAGRQATLLAVQSELEQIGLGRKDAVSGQFSWDKDALAALQRHRSGEAPASAAAPAQKPAADDAEGEALFEAALNDRTQESIAAYVQHSARAAGALAAAEVKAKVAKETEAQDTEALRERAFSELDRNLAEGGEVWNRLAPYYVDPFNGNEPDAEALKVVLASAKDIATATLDWSKAQDFLTKQARNRVALTKRAVAAHNRNRKRAKPSPKTATGSPSAGGTKNGQKTKDREFDPSDPFGHIPSVGDRLGA